MSLATMLTADVIAIAPPWRTFAGTIDGLIDLMVAAQTLSPDWRDDVRRAVALREAEGSTAVPEIGVGVPHARVAGLPAAMAALAIAPDGLYEPFPTVRVRIVALLLSPNAATEAHLKLLAGVATTLRSAPLRSALLDAESPAAALAVLRQHG